MAVSRQSMELSLTIDRMIKLDMCGYPAVIGDPSGVHASGECVCGICGNKYIDHPLDWREVGYDGNAYLHVICDGTRVKL